MEEPSLRLAALKQRQWPSTHAWDAGPKCLPRADRANVNFIISKETSLIGENRLGMDIRADFFNLFNDAQFNAPNVSIASGTFGQISFTADLRIGGTLLPLSPLPHGRPTAHQITKSVIGGLAPSSRIRAAFCPR